MPIIRSAKKALRQAKRRRSQNLERKDKIKSLTKKLRKMLASGNLEEAKKLMPELYKALDKAAKTGVMKWNVASRRKSRMARLLASRPETSQKK